MAYRTALAATMILLAGCTAPAAPSPSPTQAATLPVSPTAATTVPVGEYTGPLPIPASDGRPMLWPVATSVTFVDRGYATEVTRYGFVDVTGTLVVRPRYEGYEYCRDGAGRAKFMIGTSADRKAEVLDLTGRVVARAPTRSADCGPSGQVVFREWTEAELGIHRDGVLDIESGRIVVPMVKDRHIAAIDGSTVNVSEPAGEYFLDTRTGERTPHPGWLVDGVTLAAGAPGLPASDRREEDGLIGYVDRRGRWVAPPTFAEAFGFADGRAVVKLAEDRFTFLDARLQQVGGEWTGINAVEDAAGATVGYAVTGPAGQGLLGADLGTLMAPAAVEIYCSWDARGACSLQAADGRVSMVVLPDASPTVLPDGFSGVLSPSFVADAVGTAEDRKAWHVLAVGSGAVATLEWPSWCEGVGSAWAVCEASLPGSDEEDWESDFLPTVVIDAEGRRTGFSSVAAVVDPVDLGSTTYYMATTGRYTGLVDANGTWLYRQSRFTRLED